MQLATEIEWTQRCTERPWSCEFGHVLGGRHQASMDMHLEAKIEWSQRCTWWPLLSEFRHAHGGRNRGNLEIHFEAVFHRVWGCACRQWSSGIGGVPVGGRSRGRRDCSWYSIHWLTCNCDKVERRVQQHPPRDERLAWTGRLLILGWPHTWCMLYSVLTHGYVIEG